MLERLNIDPSVWQDAMRLKGDVFGRGLGKLDHLRPHAKTLRQSRIKGLGMELIRKLRASIGMF